MWQILQADALSIPLAAQSVQCVVTSPPYWGLRDYGTATWVGGDDGCDHFKLAGGTGAQGLGKSITAMVANVETSSVPFRDTCGKCGATRIDSQIGLEKTPEEYVAKIVDVFREVKRVLRDDGTCWVNLGDSYCTGTSAGRQPGNADFAEGTAKAQQIPRNGNAGGLKAKDLVGVPWRVAFALQAAGWYLRSDIIWSKPNPMPESVTDRPTKAHEYIFLLTKRERYYFDADAVREPHTEGTHARGGMIAESNDFRESSKAIKRGGWNELPPTTNPAGRNIRTVWEIATQPYPEAHFATFPEEIAIRCIKAGTSEKGCCKECGAPWERVTDVSYYSSTYGDSRRADVPMSNDIKRRQDEFGTRGFDERMRKESKTTGWTPSCPCLPVSASPCLVLDPFSGAGTVPLVADKLNRRGIGLELKPDYCRMAKNRCYDDAPLFA